MRLRWTKAFVIFVFCCLAALFICGALVQLFEAIVNFNRIAFRENLDVNARIVFQYLILPLIAPTLYLSLSILLLRICWIVAYRIGPSGQLEGNIGDRRLKTTTDRRLLPKADVDVAEQNPYEAPNA